MNKSISKLISFLIAFNLVLASFVGIVFADAQNIQVTPYPQVAGQMASYRMTFNINAALTAGQDSITCVFPKETNIDSTISSGNISVNPKKLNRADMEIDYQTGTIKLFNPLRKGDRVVASYRYQPGPEFTQLPRNVSFYDLTFAAPDARRGNSVLDAGEWVYEDRDNDGMISIGDKRLAVITIAGASFRQGSLVQNGDADFIVNASGSPTQPLTDYSYTNLTFIDRDGNGIFSENDWLVDDKVNSGTLYANDILIAGMFYYPRGSTVSASDLDVTTAVGPMLAPAKHAENVLKDTLLNDGEFIYTDVDATNTVTAGDTRLTWVYANGVVYPRNSVVALTDKDVGTQLITFTALAGSNEVAVNPAFPYRNYLQPRALAGTVGPSDKRTNNMFMSSYPVQSVVGVNDADANITLFAFAADEKYAGCTPLAYNTFDPVYQDPDNSGNVSEDDIRLTEFKVFVDGKEIIYTAGSVVRKGDVDVGLTLNAFPVTVQHSEKGIPNSRFDPGELIYTAAAGITNGASRENPYGVISANITIGGYYPDTGLTLTKGWGDIQNETLIAYANGGERILKLNHYPILMPVTPPANDYNNYLEQLTINGGDLKGKGKTYYTITAVSEVIGESEPWDEKMVDFTTATTFNAVRIRWSPVPYASKYKIYRTFESGSYDDSSLVGIVYAPFTEYIDLGYSAMIGKPPTDYQSSFTQITLTRNDPITGIPFSTILKEYELADYKLDTKTGRIDFRKALKSLDTIVADYDIGIAIKDEVIVIDTVSGRGKLRYAKIIDPDIYGVDDYEIKIRKATAANPTNPTLLVRGVDYEFMDEKNDKVAGLDKGMLVFYTQVATTDTIYADYVYRKEIRGDLIKVATGNETSLNTHEKNIIAGMDKVFKGRTLSSAPVINVMNSDKGPVVTFTTPVNIKPDPANKMNPTPDSNRDVKITFSMQTGIRNPMKSGNYQVFIRTSKEQTEILSNPYEIIAGEATQKLVKLTQDQSVSAGSTIALTTAVQDDLGNNIPNVTVVYSVLSSPGSAGKLDKTMFVTDNSGKAVAIYSTSPTPGDNTIQAKIQGTTQVVTFKITGLSTQPIAKVTITPATVTLAPKSSAQFSATGYDNNNNIVPNIKFAWSVSPASLGTVTDNGYFNAGDGIGTGTVTAEAFGIRGTATITVTQSSVKVEKLVITPASVTTNINKTVQFTATAYDATNNVVPNVPITWTITPVEIGTISSLGLFTAKTIGNGVILASTQDGKTAIATVSVTANVARIAISPETAIMNVGEVKQFTAIVYDENNQLVNNPTITWTVRGDIGLVTNTGIFTAQRKGIGQVVASIEGKEAAAVVTVNETSTDKDGPIITIISPINNFSTSAPTITVRGNVKDVSGVKYVKVNGMTANYDPVSGDFTSQAITLNAGNNTILVTAEDNFGNLSNKSINVTLATPIIISLQIGNRTAIITKDGMPNFVTIDLAPFTKNGRTLVPLRFISEAFGANVTWNADVPATGEGGIIIEVTKKDGTRIAISMHTNSKFMRKQVWAPGSNQPTEEQMNYDQNDPAPFVVKPQGRTVVPLRFLAEAFGAKVEWNAVNQEIRIEYIP